MNRWTVLFVSVLFVAFLTMGCSGGGVSPVSPDIGPGLTTGIENHGAQGGEVLWGYYDVYFDLENGTVEAVPNRDVMFTANVTMFVNNNVANLGFDIWGTPTDPTFIDVDIDVSISHPFPGLHQYDGWDVRGIFIGAGSGVMDYDGDLAYAQAGPDQEMYDYDLGDDPVMGYDDPYDGLVGNPDGYTRWWNAVEFGTGGPLGYVEGKLATPGYQPSLTATLNPYKYFCDDLGVEDDLWAWLTTSPNPDAHGIFTAGATNTRNYYLRFPFPDPNVMYGYAIAATWGEAPGEPPPAFVENAIEAVTCTVTVTDNIYYVDDTDNGGNLIADINLWSWGQEITAGVTEFILPSTVYVESEILGGAVSIGGTPVGGGANWSTYACDVPATALTSSEMSEFWVIAEYEAYDYTCMYPATTPDAPLAAFFRYDLSISPTPFCTTEVISINPVDGPLDTTANATITCTDVCDDPSLSALLRRAGETDIVGTNVTYVDATSYTVDFDLTGATLGVWDVVVNDGCCPVGGILVGGFEVLDMPFKIAPWSGGTPGGGVIDTAPSESGSLTIDIAVRTQDGGAYILLDTSPNHMSESHPGNFGKVDKWNPALDTITHTSAPMTVTNTTIPGDPRSDIRQNASLDCSDGGASNPPGVGIMLWPSWHCGMDENCGSWDARGYVQYPPNYPCDTTSDGTGAVWSYGGFMGGPYRSWGYRPPWSFASGTNLGYTTGGNFDGLFSNQVVGMGAGVSPDDLWSVRTVAPHVFGYTNRQWGSASGNSFGSSGTADGEISGAVDITISDAGKIYVLDSPAAGITRIQSWTFAGGVETWTATSDPSYDASGSGGGRPLRMDYNEFEECLYVLYDNDSVQVFKDYS